jgi:flavin reductase (DIM6/NTAB) family NADH-FMN oxidoreductase RutF
MSPQVPNSTTTNEARPDAKSLDGQRPSWAEETKVRVTQTPNPDWKFGDGANHLAPPPTVGHVSIDPYGEGRTTGANYRLLISTIAPRPIAFVSTRSADGESINLAPFSFFNMVHDDPPLFVLGFACSVEKAKDTLRNLIETNECVINIISDSFIEAANSCSINAPYGVSEYAVSGLTPVNDCVGVKSPRLKEAVFSIEAKLESIREFDSRKKPGEKSGTMAVVEGIHFWAREDAINEERNSVDPSVSPSRFVGSQTPVNRSRDRRDAWLILGCRYLARWGGWAPDYTVVSLTPSNLLGLTSLRPLAAWRHTMNL